MAKARTPTLSSHLTHLWRATLNIGGKKESFYFRAPDDCSNASALAGDLADRSPYVALKAARLVSVECVARLLK